MKLIPATEKKYLRFAESILGSVQDAEDVVQDCYIRLLERNRKDPVLNVEGYMMQSVRNASLDHLKRNRPEMLDEQHWENRIQTADVWQQLEHKEKTTQILQLMQLLTEKQRTVFYLRDVEGYELNEIEGLMDLNNEAVRAHLSRARKQLRVLYNKHV